LPQPRVVVENILQSLKVLMKRRLKSVHAIRDSCCAQVPCKANSLFATKPVGQTALCLFGVDLDSGLSIGSSITDLLVKGVNGAVKLLVGLLSVLVDVLLCVGAVRLELGVELAGLFAGVLDLKRY
jgi:hypothetical protein